MEMKKFSLLTLIYLIPAYVIYLIFAIHLFKKADREFQTPFFKLIKLLAIVDLTFLPISFYNYRIGSFEFLFSFFETLSEKNIPMTIMVYFYCVLQHSQFICHFLLSFNRLSAIAMFKKYNKIWSSKQFWKYYSAVILLPMLYMGWLLYFGGYMGFLDNFNYTVDSIKTGTDLLKKSTFCVVVGVSTGVLAFVMDFTTFIMVCNRPQIDHQQHFRLLGISTILLLTHMIYMFFEFFFIFPKITIMDSQTYLQSLIVMLDVQSLISPFCNIALNPYLRKSFFKHQQTNITNITIVPSVSFVSRHSSFA